MYQRKHVLFVCVGNSGRSQIAEALFNSRAPEGYVAISAGTEPAKEVNPVVVQAMREKGFDLSAEKPKAIEYWMYKEADKIILMGCSESSCPATFLTKVEDWKIEDVKGKPIEDVRRIIRTIEKKVDALVEQLAALQSKKDK
ncbi:MAG: arsenate reductase ArsC [Nitrososphaeria archaeon]